MFHYFVILITEILKSILLYYYRWRESGQDVQARGIAGWGWVLYAGDVGFGTGRWLHLYCKKKLMIMLFTPKRN